MAQNIENPVIRKVWAEQGQYHDTRVKIIEEIESKLKRPVLTYYTSFHYPVFIQDEDADMIEGILKKLNLSNGLALIINSPGGIGTAAERIINICKTYSGTKEYWAIVPNRAKSAATMICLGSSKILMGDTSELGTIDPMYAFQKNDGTWARVSMYNLVNSYWQLFRTAVETKGNIEPYIQQLERYDAREIREFENAIHLAKDIAIKALQNGMMSKLSKDEIEKKINIFLTPEETKVHERPIYITEAEKCEIEIEKISVKDKLWELLYELHIRTNTLVSTNASVCIESKYHSFIRPVDQTTMQEVKDVE